MLLDVNPYIVHEALLEDHRGDGLRSGEGSVAPLSDGSLLMIYGKFDGGKDDDTARLVVRRSVDGVKWLDPVTFCKTPKGSLNVMSVSLLAMEDGRLACVYIHKQSHDDCRPLFIISEDDGKSWT